MYHQSDLGLTSLRSNYTDRYKINQTYEPLKHFSEISVVYSHRLITRIVLIRHFNYTLIILYYAKLNQLNLNNLINCKTAYLYCN